MHLISQFFLSPMGIVSFISCPAGKVKTWGEIFLIKNFNKNIHGDSRLKLREDKKIPSLCNTYTQVYLCFAPLKMLQAIQCALWLNQKQSTSEIMCLHNICRKCFPMVDLGRAESTTWEFSTRETMLWAQK